MSSYFSEQEFGYVMRKDSRPGRPVLGKPLSRDHLEAVGHIIDARLLLSLPMFPRIDAAGQELARIVAPLPRLFQSYVRIDAQGKPLLFSLETVLVPPPLPPSRGNFKVQPAIIEQLDRLRSTLGIPDSSVGQGHFGGNSLSEKSQLPPMLPPDVNERPRSKRDNKQRKSQLFSWL